MIDLSDYVFFPSGLVELGIESYKVEKIYHSLHNSNIKKDYLSASSPRKAVYYDSFFIKKKLITVEDFKKFVSDTLYVTESEREGWGWVWCNRWVKKQNVSWRNPFQSSNDLDYSDNADIFPVMQISWNDALEYTKWLSGVTKENIRLPFEYEWETFASSSGFNSINNVFIEKNEKINSDEQFIFKLKEEIKNSEFQFGLLWEWVLDWYKGYDENTVNKDFGNIYKILRGGSLLSENIQKTKEFRFRRCPTARSPYYGFRIVLVRSF